MKDRNSKNFSFPAQIGIFLFLTGVGMVAASFLSAAIWSYSTGLSLFSMKAEMSNPKYYWTVMAMQGVSTLFMMFLPVTSFAKICYKKTSHFIGTSTETSARQYLLVLGMLLLVFPLGGALAELNKMIPLPQKWTVRFTQMEEDRKVMEDVFININTFSKYLATLLIMAVLPAIFEEFFFRGGLQNLLTRWFANPLSAIIVTAFIFSVIHASYYGFLVRFSLGLVLGYIYYYSANIWLPVFLHFLFNGLQVTAIYVLKSSDKINARDIEENFPLWMGVVALGFLILLFQYFKKESFNVRKKFVYREPDDRDIHDWIA